MARARNIKPAFFQNEVLAETSFAARLLFIGLWTLVDFKGCLEYRPKRIRATLFPYDNDVNIDDLIDQLETSEVLRKYIVNDRKYIKVINFVKHQRPHKQEIEAGSEIPDAPEVVENREVEQLPNNFGSTSEVHRSECLISDSLTPIPKEQPPAAARQEDGDMPPVEKRKDHPAIVTVQSVTHRYPPKEIWDDIIDHVGAIDIDAVRMRKCFTTWVSRGFNKVNYDWLFDWYVNNRIPEAGNKTNGTNNKSYQDRRAELAREQFEIESDIRRRIGERDRGLSGAALLDNSRQLQSFRPDAD